MPQSKTSLPILDQEVPIELVLDLASFSGGENIKGEDIELKSNEAREIKNWDVESLGGMIRSKGFNEVAANAYDDEYDKLIIHCDGTDASTSFVDTVAGKTISAGGTAQVDTAQKKFGTGSLLLDGNSDYISIPDSADWDFSDEPFTIDMWARIHTDQDCILIGQYQNANNYWYLKYDATNSLLKFYWKDGGTDRANYSFTWNPTLDAWYHVECARNGSNFYIFIDGTAQTLTATTAIGTTTLANIAAALIIGQQNSADYFDGWIDEIRVSNGIARHIATFTVETQEYVYNSAPDLLIHHDESGSAETYAIISGDLVYKNSAKFTVTDAAGFSRGILSNAISQSSKLWITNPTDNLKYKTIAGPLITPASQPASARSRIYYHQSRLIAEGDGVRIYGSRAGSGNWLSCAIGAVVFTGAGLNDATSGGTYTLTVIATYEVEIDATGTPDTFKWRKNGGSYTTGVAITGSAQTLSDGVTITFAATTGHTLADKWSISVTGTGWSTSNDAWNIDLPDDTQGGIPGFPSGSEFAVFTKFAAYTVYNFPNVAYRKITNSRGCCAPYSIAQGDEGVFFLSQYPTIGVFFWDRVNFTDLTTNHDFIDDINLSGRIFGSYRNNKYYLFYNKSGSTVTYPNKCMVYDLKFRRWMERPINTLTDDNFGYPALLKYASNEIYCASSQKAKLYELETDDNSDEGQNTEAIYKTKDFSSRDFLTAAGGQFPIDEVRMKLVKEVVTYYGTLGNLTIQWTSDRGARSGSHTIDLTASGDKLNSTFIVNQSYITVVPPDKTIIKSFPNNAVGRRFNFQVINRSTGERPKIKRIKIHAIAFDEA